jgi:hypothetical protein
MHCEHFPLNSRHHPQLEVFTPTSLNTCWLDYILKSLFLHDNPASFLSHLSQLQHHLPILTITSSFLPSHTPLCPTHLGRRKEDQQQSSRSLTTPKRCHPHVPNLTLISKRF